MAYDTQTDYKALQDALRKQKAATTDSATQAALQSQIDAAEQSRTEKIASDLTAYGKYANDSELNNAAGIMAQNQIGTGYETQKANLNLGYDNAKQNANNDALSRGMARSSFVGDRMANLDSQRANALAGVDASKALAIQNARTSIIDNYRTNTANALANEKADYSNNQMTHYQDYQAEINRVRDDGDPTNDWQADKLQGWRNEKLLAQEAAALKAAQAAAKTSGGGSSYRGGSESKTATADTTGNPAVEFNSTGIDETSPYGVITDIDSLKGQGFTAAQIKANAKAAYEAGKITAAQYQMYVQYAGRN